MSPPLLQLMVGLLAWRARCLDPHTLVYTTPVLSETGSLIGTVNIFDEDEPADVAFEFCVEHNLTIEYREAILADACENIECYRVEPILFQLPIELGDDEEAVLTILEGQDPLQVIDAFCLEHGLDSESRDILIEEAASSPYLPDFIVEAAEPSSLNPPPSQQPTPSSLPLYTTPVIDEDDNIIGIVSIYAGQEPADVAFDFTEAHGLSEDYFLAILSDACSSIDCMRVEPRLYKLPVDLGGGKIELLEIFKGEDPLAKIVDFCRSHGVGEYGRGILIENAKQSPRLTFSSERVLLWAQDVVLEGGKNLGQLSIYHGDEPADAVRDFADSHGLVGIERAQVIKVLVSHACDAVGCSRRVPLAWSESVLLESGENAGVVEVLEGVEPIDAIDRWVKAKGLDVAYRESILSACCEQVECTREKPILFTQTVNNEHGQQLGVVNILEGEEVVDPVVRFIIDKQTNMDAIPFKNFFFGKACHIPGVLCTRNVAMLYKQEIIGENATSLGTLEIFENEEPVDKVWSFLINTVENELERERFFFNLKSHVCPTKYINCRREAPLVFGPQGISGPDGNTVGHLTVMLGEDPVDATYKFFARFGLFQKDWDFPSVFNQVCKLPGLEGKCKRQEPIKYIEKDARIGDKQVGDVIVWGYEEVIDVMYRKRLEYNLTVTEQMTKFTDICKSEEVHCGKSVAVASKRSVNKLDYDKAFGMSNSTCPRKYCGWRYISGWEGPMQTYIIPFMNGDTAHLYFEDQNFAWNLYMGLVCLARALVGRKRRIGWASWGLLLMGSFVSTSWIYYTMVDPDPAVDQAMHEFLGKLPEIEVDEGGEVADAIWMWAKAAEKEHHPLQRKPLYWDLMDELCDELPVHCTRRKAFDKMDFGSITLWGIEHKMFHWKDPNKTMEEEIDAGEMYKGATKLCERLIPEPPNCVTDIEKHYKEQYKLIEGRRLDEKDLYKKIGVVSDTTAGDIYHKSGLVLRTLGFNVVPFERVDNGTKMYHRWDTRTTKGYSVLDKLGELLNDEDREWYDKPCEPVFGGAMCAKKDAKGNMMIEMG